MQVAQLQGPTTPIAPEANQKLAQPTAHLPPALEANRKPAQPQGPTASLPPPEVGPDPALGVVGHGEGP
jgi:hypothetical protein